MIYRAAVVRESDHVVENIVIADEASEAPIGCYLVSVDGRPCNLGWSYDRANDTFVSNDPPATEEVQA